jgi:sugar phosphate isomerase/epimerase
MNGIGFVSAIFAQKSFEEVIDFAAANGFTCVELMCWPKGKADRRYAGVTHVDADAAGTGESEYIKQYTAEKNVQISSLGYYPNPLDPDSNKRDFYLAHLKKVIKAAALLGVPVVNTFIGRDQYKNHTENVELFKSYWPPLVRFAEEHQIKIAIENCPMLFTKDEWPGGRNLAVSPQIWDQLFSIIPGNFFGLNYDPSHLVWQQMDYIEPLINFREKIFHVHIKDAKIYKEKLDKVGILAEPLAYHSPKLPGHGDIDWATFFKTLRSTSYKGNLVIEFEDKAYESSEELIIKGLLETKAYLQQFL